MKELMEQRANLFKQMDALHEKARAEKRDLTPDEVKEWDRLDGELTQLDARIERENKFEARKAQGAQSAGTLVGAQGGAAPAEANGKLFGSKFGRWGLSVSDVEFLYDLEEAAAQARVSSGPTEELRNAFEDLSKAMYIPQDEIRRIDRQAIDNMFPRITKRNAKAYEAEMRAMDTAESGYGSQLVGASYVGELWEAARKESRIFNLLDSKEMLAPTEYIPVEVDFPEMLYVSENTSATASDYSTSKTGSQNVTTTAKKFLIHQVYSGEMEEDSIIPYVPFLRRQQALSLAYYSDSAVLNGDVTGTNGINGSDSVLTSTKHTLAFDGIRHAALVDNTGNSASAANAAVSLELFKGIYGRMIDETYMHDWGHPNDPADVVHIVDPWVGDAMMLMDEFLTMDKFGANATILNGQVARVFQHPVIATIACKKSEITGYVDETAADDLYGQIVTFNKRGLKVGWRRRVKLEVERLPGRDQTRIVSSLRMGLGRFTPTGAASGIEWADAVYYISI